MKALTSVQKISRGMFDEFHNDRSKKASEDECLTVGLLDIFGFEAFVNNSLEQLLINYANEKLLREFNRQVFEAAAKEYADEGAARGAVDTTGATFF